MSVRFRIVARENPAKESPFLPFSGDHILPKITPFIPLEDAGDDMLEKYTSSLDKVYNLEQKLIAPGHGALIEKPYSRIEQMKLLHIKRSDKIINLIGNSKFSGWEIVNLLFPRKLDELNLRLAFQETMAHLIYLENKGLIKYSSKQDFYNLENSTKLVVERPIKYSNNAKNVIGVLEVHFANTKQTYQINQSISYVDKIDIPETSNLSFMVAIILAFFGGIILNIMPCVFPVIALKVMSFVKESSEKNAWRHGCLLYTSPSPRDRGRTRMPSSA